MFRVSSWVVTTGADNLAATCSSLGCIIPRRPKLLAAPPLVSRFPPPCERDARDEMLKVSQKTISLSWSTSITSAVESEGQEGNWPFNDHVGIRNGKLINRQRSGGMSTKLRNKGERGGRERDQSMEIADGAEKTRGTHNCERWWEIWRKPFCQQVVNRRQLYQKTGNKESSLR